MRIRIGRLVSHFSPLAVVLLAALVLGQQPGGQPPTSSPTASGAGLLGQRAPNFEVTTLDGKQVSLADYKGKALIVNFWATWCGNCKLEMPWLAELRKKYKDENFEVLGILTNNATPEKVARLTAQYGVHYPILMCNHKTAQAYGGLSELPASFFIDRRGIVVAEMNGADSEQEIEANLRKALKQ